MTAPLHVQHPWPIAPQRTRAAQVDPIVLQIVEGTLNSIEAEIEYAIERTARTPMIREAHDYRVGLFDRHCRKLTGRSYSAMPNAVVRDFPPETMRPGDVFLMNDTYLTEGSIGHLPDLCSTVPVFHDGEVVAYIQAFGHHDDIGGRVPGSMPGTADDRVRGRPRDPADQALRRRRAQRGGVHHHQAQHPRARDAGRRSRQRGAGLRDGRAPHGGAVRALRRARPSRPASRRSSTSAATSTATSCCRRSPTANTPGRTTSSTTASPIPSCTSSRSR